MQKTFNAFEKATVKNSAKAVAHYQAKNETIDKKIKDLEAEKEMNNAYIEQYSKPVRELTGGYEPLELCEKVSRGSQNDWVFKYPDTIVPPVQEETREEEKKEEKEEKVEQNEHLYKEEVTLKVPQEETVSGPENVFDDDPFNSAKQSDDDDFFNDDEFK